MKVDLSKCPKCGGPADNGHDRCYPPNPYYCSICEAAECMDEATRKDSEPHPKGGGTT